MGDIKLSERPQNYTLAPESKRKIKANFKVSYTETGVIFGTLFPRISWSGENIKTMSSGARRTAFGPPNCQDTTVHEQRTLLNNKDKQSSILSYKVHGAEFEWENMKCLTPTRVGVSLEKQTNEKLSGYIRIRSKRKRIALSLGDRITLKQKGKSS
ncbi:hypothetical protein YC2023_122824 [Brassica napus]